VSQTKRDQQEQIREAAFLKCFDKLQRFIIIIIIIMINIIIAMT